MRRALLTVVLVGLALVPTSSGVEADTPQLARPPTTITQYGYVRSLARAGSTYRLRFDPALWLSGETANRAAAEDRVIGPGETVPNDYYVRNEGRRQLTYVVPRSARVTVVTNPGAGPRSTRITVAELASITRGGNPRGRKLMGRSLGYWARIVGDRVVRLDQQYQP